MAGAPPVYRPQGFWDDEGESWLDQAIGGMGDLISGTWGGINDLGEQWFGGGPTDFSGQVETARRYSEDTANQYEDIARNPIGYARDNPSATLASLVGLAAGGGGSLLRALPNAPNAPSRAGGITSRLSNADEAGIQGEFAATLERLMREERGGNLPENSPEAMYDELLSGKGYYDETGHKYTPKGQLLQKLLQESSIGRGTQRKYAPTTSPETAARIQRALNPSISLGKGQGRATIRSLMKQEDTGERFTAQGRQESFSPERVGEVGGDSQQWAPYDAEAEASLAGKPPPPPRKPRRARPSNAFNERYNNVTEATEGMRPRTYDKRGVEISDEPISGGFEKASYLQGNLGRSTPSELNPLGITGVGQVISKWDDVPDDYFYHASPADRFESIRRTGLESSRRETPGSAGTHFTEQPHDYPFLEDAPRNLFRVRRDAVRGTRRSDSDWFTEENVTPDKLDVYQGEGNWVRVGPRKVDPPRSTLQDLNATLAREGQGFKTDAIRGNLPAERSYRVKPNPQPMPKNTSGPTPAQLRSQRR